MGRLTNTRDQDQVTFPRQFRFWAGILVFPPVPITASGLAALGWV